MPWVGAMPVVSISQSRPNRAATSSASAVARASVHEIDGATGRPSASVSTTGSRWLTTPRPAIRAGFTAAAASASRTVRASPRYQSSGSFSAQPGRGWCIGCSAEARASRVPSQLASMVFTAPVPMSHPIRTGPSAALLRPISSRIPHR
jgi:hypothetical protein